MSMKVLITKQQHNLISEAMGVPDSILDAAEELYEMIGNNLKSINYESDEYNFQGNVDIEMGYKKKVKINEYKLNIDVHEVDDLNETAKIVSMGMGQSFMFDTNLFMRRIEPSTSAEFSITYIVTPDWKANELYDEFISKKDEYISSVAHEIKHKYDKQVKPIGLMGDEAIYQAIQTSPRFNIDVIDNKFFLYLYYIIDAESLVRPTEVASNIRNNNITKKQFKEFIKDNRTFKTLFQIRDFTFEKLVEGLYDDMDRVNNIMELANLDPNKMTPKEKIDKILELVYINLVNVKLKHFREYTEERLPGMLQLFSGLGVNIGKNSQRIDNIRQQFLKHVIKYENNPTQFFKDEINNFKNVSNKMIKRISKLYDMAKEDEVVTESIIDWELHSWLMREKYGEVKFTDKINK